MAPRFFVETLGCPKNAVDSDKVVASLLADGLSPVDHPEDADLVVVNTCAFVEAARDNEKSGSIQPGEYTLHQQMSGASAVTLLLDPSARSADKVTVREGLRVNEILPLLYALALNSARLFLLQWLVPR